MFPKTRIMLLIITILSQLEIFRVNAFFKITKTDCFEIDPAFMKASCKLKPISRGVTALDGDFYLKEIVHNCIVNLRVFKKTTTYNLRLLNLRANACDFMKNRRKFPTFEVVYNMFSSFSNINHTCPYEGHVIVKNFSLHHEKLILPLPSGEYKLFLDWIMNKALRLSVLVWFSFEEQKNGSRTFEILI